MELSDPTNPPKQRHTILVVDDEEMILAALSQTLQQANYEVFTTPDPLVALAELKNRTFSVIISDQRMPTMTGLELLTEARKIQPNATRILITAVLSLDTVIEAINAGEIYRFIVKPWLREEFMATVQNGVQRYELIGQNLRLQASTQAMNEQLVELNRSMEHQAKLVAERNEQLAKLNDQLERALLRSHEICINTTQTFYPSLGSQARRASQICHSMCEALKLSPEDRRVLESASLLYDVGLVGVPRQIIRRWQEDPNSLSHPEKALVGQHPILGQELASFGSGLDQVGVVIRAHHERFDGTGYPDQLVGTDIPWMARLLAVAVEFASSHETPSDTVEKIKLGANTAFDPEAIRVLLRVLPMTSIPRNERDVLLGELRPGMVLSRGIYTGNGLLLLPEGQLLNATYIEKLLNHNRIQPISQSLTVYC